MTNNLPPDVRELEPCRVCGAECRVETFPASAILQGGVTLWICSANRLFGGGCPDETAYFNAEAWNAHDDKGK